jgi:exosortase
VDEPPVDAARAIAPSDAPPTPGATHSAPLIAGLFTRRGLLATLIVAGAFLLLFFRWYWLQIQISAREMEDWGHCLVVPLFSAYLVWRDREAVSSLRPEPFWPGVIALLTGIVAYFFYVAGHTVHMAQGCAIVLALSGVVLVVLGLRAFRRLFIPIAFLVFMIEVADSWMTLITAPLRTIAAVGGYVALSVLSPLGGYQVDRGGNVLTIYPSGGAPIPLDIAEACSGMRMVMAFVALACVVAILGCRAWWQRVALVLLAIPVAIVINVVRVVILGLLSLIDPGLAGGDAHMLIGTILLLPGFGLFWLTKWALDRIMHTPTATETRTTPAGAIHAGARTPRRMFQAGMVATAAILGCSAVGMGAAIHYYKVYLQKLETYPESGADVRSVPSETSLWSIVGSDTVYPQEMVDELGTRNYLTRLYQRREPRQGKPNRDMLDLHLAYYTGLLDAVPHVPERCFTGSGLALSGGPWIVDVPLASDGWVPDDEWKQERGEALYTARTSNQYSRRPGQRVALPRGVSPTSPLRLRVSEYTDSRGNRAFAGYFFIANGGWVSSAEGVRELAFKLSDRYAYFLKVQVQSTTVEQPEELAALAGSLLDEILADIMFTVPDWRRVQRGQWPPSGEPTP